MKSISNNTGHLINLILIKIERWPPKNIDQSVKFLTWQIELSDLIRELKNSSKQIRLD